MNIPFGMRVGYHRFRRMLDWWLHPLPWATEHKNLKAFPLTLLEKTSPLQRAPDGAIATFTDEKTQNLRLACQQIDGLVLPPNSIFSFCRTVGKTTTKKGYLPALELHDGDMQPSVGGGLCQLSNLLLLLALEANAEIVERHRHSYDLFRDVERAVPFGCGATVFYNYVDFQFRNRLPFPVCIYATVTPPVLRASIHAEYPLPFRISIRETDHGFFRQHDQVYRKNCIWRHIEWLDGRVTERELLFNNVCRVLYPADDLVSEDIHV